MIQIYTKFVLFTTLHTNKCKVQIGFEHRFGNSSSREIERFEKWVGCRQIWYLIRFYGLLVVHLQLSLGNLQTIFFRSLSSRTIPLTGKMKILLNRKQANAPSANRGRIMPNLHYFLWGKFW